MGSIVTLTDLCTDTVVSEPKRKSLRAVVLVKEHRRGYPAGALPFPRLLPPLSQLNQRTEVENMCDSQALEDSHPFFVEVRWVSGPEEDSPADSFAVLALDWVTAGVSKILNPRGVDEWWGG